MATGKNSYWSTILDNGVLTSEQPDDDDDAPSKLLLHASIHDSDSVMRYIHHAM